MIRVLALSALAISCLALGSPRASRPRAAASVSQPRAVAALRSLLANGGFEERAPGAVPGWSAAFYPQAGGDIHACVAQTASRVRTGTSSLLISTRPVLGQETTLVFNGSVAGDYARLAGRTVALTGWVFVEPGTAVRPITMRLRAFTRQDFLGDALEIQVVGTPGRWTRFRAEGVVPRGDISSMDLHCAIHPDVVPTVQYLDDLTAEEAAPPPLSLHVLRRSIWSDDAVLPVETVLSDRELGSRGPGSGFRFRLTAGGHDVGSWIREKRPGRNDLLAAVTPPARSIWGLALPKVGLAEGAYRLRADWLAPNGKSDASATASLEVVSSPWAGVRIRRTRPPGSYRIGGVPDGFRCLGSAAPTDLSDTTPGSPDPVSRDIDLRSVQKGGYAVFTRQPLDAVSRLGRPRPGENAAIRLFACPGQYVPAQVAVWALRMQSGVRVAVGDLAGPGAVISSTNTDVRVVRAPRGLPPFLEQRESVDIPAGQSQAYRITLYVPPSTPRGFYSGEVRIATRGGPVTYRGLLLRVLPLKLPPPPRGYGFWWTLDRRWHGYYCNTPAEALRTVRRQFVLLREHGCNMVSVYGLPKITRAGVGWTFDFARDMFGDGIPLEDLFRIGRQTRLFRQDVPLQYPGIEGLREYGPGSLRIPGDSADFDALFRGACRRIDAWCRSQGFRPAFACVDEIGNSPERRAAALKYYRLATDAGVLTSVTDNSTGAGMFCTGDPRYANIMRMRLYNFVLPEEIETTRRTGGVLWLYNLGSGGWNPLLDRFVFGLFTERCAAEGCAQWAFQWPQGNASPYEAARVGKPSGYHYALPAPDGPLSTLAMEAVRDGIDDARYVCLACARNSALRTSLLRSIEPSSPRIRAYLESHDGSSLDAGRWRLARAALGPPRAVGAKRKVRI